jgi:UDP-N-acetylmuramoylalanine--D-glutamate ligase
MNLFAQQVKGKKVLVFGLGRQGGGAGDAAWLEKNGAIVRTSDKDLSLVPEGQTSKQIDWAEMIIKNPGVPDNHELLIYAKSKNIPILTSIAVFVKYSSLQVIGITGTRGKSTVTALTTTLLETAFPGQVVTGGNIPGTSGLSLFDQEEGKKYAVLELSSFQLHNFHDLRVSPSIAVVTNLYPDHLNRYGSMAEYQHDKEAIVAYQKSEDITLLNQDNPGAIAISQASLGQKHPYSAAQVTGLETTLPGKHNRENLAAMLAVGEILGIPETTCKQVAKDFRGLPFRQEIVRSFHGVNYVNDTTATTPTAAVKALQAATTPLVWITGGDTKNLPFDELIYEVKINPHLKKIIILGSKNIPDYTSALAQVASDKIVGTATSMKEAIDLASSITVSGDTILLSPGFASFDLFQNEFDRGRQFNELVKVLA